MFPLLVPLAALSAGILCSQHLDPRPVLLCLPLSVWIAYVRRRYTCVAVFLLGASVPLWKSPAPPEPPAEAARVEGTLLKQPEWRGLGVYLDLEVKRVDGRDYHGRARLTEFLDDPALLEMFQQLQLGTGDDLEVVVKLQHPARYRNPGVFNFRRHLSRQGIYWTGTIRNPRLITVVERGPALWRFLDSAQRRIEDRVSRPFAEDRVARGLVMGMVLGRKHELTASLERRFQDAGLYHLVVVSGFNLAVVAGVAAALARLICSKRSTRLILVMLAVIAYTLIVGGQTPVLRATLMVGILVAGKALDRDYSPANTIALAALVLLLWDPSLLQDTSFQMTFAAVAAVTCAGQPASRWLLGSRNSRLADFGNAAMDGWMSPEDADWRLSRRMWCELYGLPHAVVTVPRRIVLWTIEAMIVSIAVEVVLAYFMIESFHILSPISPFLNVPAGLAAAVITPLGLLLLLLPEPLAGFEGWIIQSVIRILIWLLDFCLTIPYATIRVPSAPVWLWLVYLAAGMVCLHSVVRRRRGWCVAGVSAVGIIQGCMVVLDFSPPPPADVTLTFLDVGQGDSTLLEFPDGRRMLVDGGGVAAGRFLGLQDRSTFSIGEDVISPYLFSRGIRRVDTVVLTHAHNDHMDGLSDVLSNFRVGELWLGRNPGIPAYTELLTQAQEKGVRLHLITAGYREAGILVLHPPGHWQARRTASNNDSIVLLLETGQQTALLAGDLELAIPVPAFVNVLKVPHHGSRGVRLRTRSDVRVISVGANNPFGHPHPTSLPALRTDLFGAIQVRMSGARPHVDLIGMQKPQVNH